MLEGMQRRLEEEHALQMSLLLAQQEREQQRLCLVSVQNDITNQRRTFIPSIYWKVCRCWFSLYVPL